MFSDFAFPPVTFSCNKIRYHWVFYDHFRTIDYGADLYTNVVKDN